MTASVCYTGVGCHSLLQDIFTPKLRCWGFPNGSAGKEPASNTGDVETQVRSLGRGNSDTCYNTDGLSWASLVAQRLKRLPAMLETWVRSLGREDPLEKEMTTHSSILAGESHGRRSLVGYSPQGCKESDTTERLQFHFHFQFDK